jgi:hypothetical protein
MYSFTWTFAAEGPQTSRASHQQSPKEKTGEHFILHAGDGLQVSGMCQSDASKV